MIPLWTHLWTDAQLGLLGGVLGSMVGVMGAVFGVVAGYCAPKGKCKRVVYALTAFEIGTGVVLLTGGVVALITRQPYGVSYTLLLCGCLLTFIVGANFFPIRAAYRKADMRRMEAEELRRGSAA